jgi:2-aminoadipate transaminase
MKLRKTVINLTRGVPPVDVFPVEDLIACQEAALRRDAEVLLQYSHAGYLPLREWLGQQYAVGPEQVLTGNSSMEIFSFIAEVLVPNGARAFVESPSYDRAITALRRTGAEVVGIPLESDGVNLTALERELEKGVPGLMYLIADFQNPMGITTSLEKRQQVVALAESYDFWIIEDAPYRALRYWGEEVPTLRSLAPDRVLHMSSFSKVLSPGLRLGYVVGPADMLSTLGHWATDWYIGPVLPSQGMVYEYCRRGLLPPNIERLKAKYRTRLAAILSALDKHIPQATWTRPEGGFFVSGTLPEGSHIAGLLERAPEVGLKLADGRGFFPEPEDGVRFLRIPFCSLTEAEIEEGVSRLARLL